jgi:hypothetical protein
MNDNLTSSTGNIGGAVGAALGCLLVALVAAIVWKTRPSWFLKFSVSQKGVSLAENFQFRGEEIKTDIVENATTIIVENASVPYIPGRGNENILKERSAVVYGESLHHHVMNPVYIETDFVL